RGLPSFRDSVTRRDDLVDDLVSDRRLATLLDQEHEKRMGFPCLCRKVRLIRILRHVVQGLLRFPQGTKNLAYHVLLQSLYWRSEPSATAIIPCRRKSRNACTDERLRLPLALHAGPSRSPSHGGLPPGRSAFGAGQPLDEGDSNFWHWGARRQGQVG